MTNEEMKKKTKYWRTKNNEEKLRNVPTLGKAKGKVDVEKPVISCFTTGGLYIGIYRPEIMAEGNVR